MTEGLGHAQESWASPVPAASRPQHGDEVRGVPTERNRMLPHTVPRSACSPQKAISLAAHAAAAAGVAVYLHGDARANGGRPKPPFRCDIVGWAFAASALVMHLWIAVAVQGLRGPCEPKIALAFHFLRCIIAGLGAAGLFAHWPLGLVLLACAGGASTFTAGVTSVGMQIWRHFAPDESFAILPRIYHVVQMKLALLATFGFLLVAAATIWVRWEVMGFGEHEPGYAACIAQKNPNCRKVGYAEHFAIFAITGACLGAAICALHLWWTWFWRSPWSWISVTWILDAVLLSGALHIAALLGSLAAVVASPFISIVLAAAFLVLRAGHVEAAEEAAQGAALQSSFSQRGVAASVSGRLLSQVSSISEVSSSKSSKGSMCEYIMTLVRVLSLALLSLLQAAALFLAFLFDVQLVKSQFRGTESGRCDGSAPEFDPQAATGNIGTAMGQQLGRLGLASLEPAVASSIDAIGSALEKSMSLRMDVSDMLNIHCVALRRLGSALVVWAAVITALTLGAIDILSVIGAGLDVADARQAARSSSIILYLVSFAVLKALEVGAIVTLQWAITTGVVHAKDGVSIFDRCRGHLVGPEHFGWTSCPNVLHPVAEVVANAAMVSAILCALSLLIALAAGALYGLPPARWVVSMLFGKYLKLSNFTMTSTTPNTEESSTRTIAASMPVFQAKGLASRMLRPLAGVQVTFGIWTAQASRSYSVGLRQEWYEPVGAPGGHDLVSWRCMYRASSKALAIGWYALPGVGSLMAKSTDYMNQYVLFAWGCDGCDGDGAPTKILEYFFDKDKRSLQTFNWASMAIQLSVLCAIETGFLDGKAETQLRVLGVCVSAILLLALLRVTGDLIQQAFSFGLQRALIERSDLVLQSGIPKALAGERAIADVSSDQNLVKATLRHFDKVCGAHQHDLAVAASELLQLTWVREGNLLDQYRTEIIGFSKRTSTNKLWARRLVEPSMPNGEVALQLVLLLREVADSDIVRILAPHKAQQQAETELRNALQPRADWLTEWARNRAEEAALSEASTRTSGKRLREEDRGADLQVRVTFAASTRGCAAVAAVSKSSQRQIGSAATCIGTVCIRGSLVAKPLVKCFGGLNGAWKCTVTDEPDQNTLFDIHGSADVDKSSPEEAAVEPPLETGTEPTLEDASGLDGSMATSTSYQSSRYADSTTTGTGKTRRRNSNPQATSSCGSTHHCFLCKLDFGASASRCKCCHASNSGAARPIGEGTSLVRQSWHLQALEMEWTAAQPDTELLPGASLVENCEAEGVHWTALIEYEGPELEDDDPPPSKGFFSAVGRALGISAEEPAPIPQPDIVEPYDAQLSDASAELEAGQGESTQDAEAALVEGDTLPGAPDDDKEECNPIASSQADHSQCIDAKPKNKYISMLEDSLKSARRLGLPAETVAAAEASLERALQAEAQVQESKKESDVRKDKLKDVQAAVTSSSDSCSLHEAVRAARAAGVAPEVILAEFQALSSSCSDEQTLAIELEAKTLNDELASMGNPLAFTSTDSEISTIHLYAASAL